MTINIDNNSLAIFESPDGTIKVYVRVLEETVWLSLKQISELFDRDKSVVAKHIKNIFREEELDKDSVVANFATTAQDGKVYDVEYYNLDMILTIGYRVNSKRGMQFRKWASNIIKEFLIKGYSLNSERLVDSKIKELQVVIDLMSKTLVNNKLFTITGEGVIEIIKAYSKTWNLLIKYDENTLEIPNTLHSSNEEIISYHYAKELIANFKLELRVSGLFGIERGDAFKGILGNIMQSFAGKNLYPSIEERAAHLLYFTIKDHPFSDGNKRIGSLLFLIYLKMVGFNLEKMNANTITALTLLVAESDAAHKDIMIKLIVHILT